MDPPTPSNLQGESNKTKRVTVDASVLNEEMSSPKKNFQRVGDKKKRRLAERRNVTLEGMKKMEKS